MSIRNLILGVNGVTVSYLIHYDSLLQNATDVITTCSSYFITKMRQIFYYKMRRLLQIATVQLNKAVKKNVHQSFLTSILVSRYLFV